MRPCLIGIAGASCSGKTTVTEQLVRRLHVEETIRIALDSYYYDLSHLSPAAIDHHNLDEPAALDQHLLIEQVTSLAKGRSIDKPVYDYKTHTRAKAPEHIEPKPFVVIEGLFALYWEDIRDRLTLKVFIDLPHDICLARRIERDRSQRGRSTEEATQRYRRTVAPMFDKHVLPTRDYADTILDGLEPPEQSADTLIASIQKIKNNTR